MAVLGIESSAHTFGVGVIENGKVLANFKSMYKISDKGLVPSKVADFHSRNGKRAIEAALKKSGIDISDIKGIGYTKGPGIGSCLRTGQLAAKSISLAYSIPIFPVNHALAHVEITKHICGAKNPIALYVSGGNSQILALAENPYKHYYVLGETFDIGVGNMIDVFARAAKLKPAWGSTVARIAESGKYIQMPYTVKGMDFTFTGLLTHAVKQIGSRKIEDISFSIQETAFAMLCEATERALLLTRKKELILCGGVAQSVRLRSMLGGMCSSHNAKLHFAPDEFNADNGAMIAFVAEKMMQSGMRFSIEDADTDQHYRIDKVRVGW